jgi:hypothetical protein
MITNIPTKSEFENVAKENLTQSFNLLYKVHTESIDLPDEIMKEEIPAEEIWIRHHGTIRTALILLHQALEGLMKSSICAASPLLLIDKSRREWPSLPESHDKDFDSLYTIGGEALLTTFCAVPGEIVKDNALVDFIEDIRRKRNQAVHGTDIRDLSPNYIIKNVLNAFTIWFGKDTWQTELRQNLLDNPLFGYFDADYENAISYRFLDFALSMIGKSELAKHLSVDIGARPYFCPECKRQIECEFDSLASKWAFLHPNDPASTTICCASCQQSFPVIRKKCGISGCKGNVLFEDADWHGGDVCLTCFSIHEYEEESE